MSRKKILVVNDLHELFLELLDKDQFDIDYKPHISKEEVLNIIENYHGLVVRSKIRVDQELVSRAKHLEFVGRAGAGIDNIDESALRGTNIQVFNAPEGNRDAVGEHSIGMILNLFNHIGKANEQVINKVWQREANRGIELGSKTVGIIGFGNTGQSLAKKLSGFGCEVLAHDKYHSDRTSTFASLVSMQEIQERCDVVSIHVPLTSETDYLADNLFFSGFKKGFYLINTSRGRVVSLKALLTAIDNGIVLGAALDVLENENLNTYSDKEQELFQGLVDSGKVIFTPHVAGWTFESYRKISEVLANKILKHYEQAVKVV